MTDLFIVRERNNYGDPEGWISFHRTEEGALAAMRRIAAERAEDGGELDESKERIITLEDGYGQIQWWIDKETLED